ncbi:Flp family type IVb pilin [Ectobacillus ponti]|uniref:Flp family type IVb pilin n=1 Tax=Ectobacillus ponti TaxID=2961894 RepID=A0AA41X9F9_9BACI|nr:Flp family type IVb pilin [Ectobacillus ponti]MCP8969320.1 Flp family type IVb pilin [Ectobacillus ponti]
MLERVKHLVADEEGQGMAEYGLILALVAVVAAAALTPLGTGIKAKFNEVVTKLGGTPAP